jgi:hypothetical protein
MRNLSLSEEQKTEIINKFKEYAINPGLSIYIVSVKNNKINCEVSQRSDAQNQLTKEQIKEMVAKLFEKTVYRVEIEIVE